MVFKKIKNSFSGLMSKESSGEDYIEIDTGLDSQKSKVSVKPFILKKFEDTNEILNSLREGYTIAIIDIQQLRKKDVIELKRAISKIKKTTEALEGSITGFGENIVIATPQFAQITPPTVEMPEKKDRFDMY
ncbi:MAG TPA: cell division protein SepF [Candidatus Paceibacterota bacterium]|nr:cell division protein SepF [Candidatus Paceibacterota bacterium]